MLLAAGAVGVDAKETTIYSKDYSADAATFWNGSPEDVSVGVENGQLVIVNNKEQTENYTLQLHVGSGITTTAGLDYQVKIEYKTTAAGSVWVGLGNWSNRATNYNVPLTASDDFQTAVISFNEFQWSATDNFIMWQSGKLVGTVYIKKVEVVEIAPDETIESSVYKIDYSESGFNFWNGSPEDVSVSVADGQLNIVNGTEQAQNYTLQLHLASGITTTAGLDYQVKIVYKTTAAGSVWVGLGNWSNRATNYNVPLTVSDDFQTLVINFDDFQWSATDNFVMWQSGKLVGTVSIKSVEIIEIAPADPLALPKEALKNAIAAAETQSSFAKTAESWNVLTEALADAQAALADDAATVESLEAATTALNEAVSGLQLTVGYSNLTAEMFMHHESLDATEGTQVSCTYVVGTSTGQPYGDGSVNYLNWADLTGYSKLAILVTDGTPRIMMNRLTPVEGGDVNGGDYVQITDAPVNGIVEVDLTQYDYAHLNAIKGANWQNVTVTGMYLYRDMSYAIVGGLTGGWEKDVEMTPTETEGEYTLTVQNFVATEDAYNYKLRANGDWNIYQLPAGSENASWTPEEGIGYYTLTFTANVLKHTLNCVGEKTADFEYAVVGCTYEGSEQVQSELFAGTKAWDTNTTDVMTKQNDGTYVWENNEVVLPAKWIDLKVIARDGENVIKWYGNNEGGNVGLNINETGEGIYNVTVTFNGSTVTATAEKQPTATIYFVNANDWPAANIKVWVWNDSHNYTGGDWSNQPTMTPTGEQIDGKDVYSWSTYELNPTPKYVIISNNGSYTDRTGDQPFVNGATYRPDGTSTVTKTIGTAGYATFYCSSALDFSESGLTAYIAKKDANNKVTFEAVTTVPANTGVLLKGAAGEYTINTVASSETNVVDNVFVGVLADTKVAAGIFVLMNGDLGVGFYETKKEFTVGANTAYIPAIAGARSFIALDEATAIEGVAAEKVGNGEIYNLQGQRVVKAQKGLYIIDGKKVMVK